MQELQKKKNISFLPFQVIRLIDDGILLQRPNNCPDTVYHVMLGCWRKNPKDRFTFSRIHKHLKDYNKTLAICYQPSPIVSSSSDMTSAQEVWIYTYLNTWKITALYICSNVTPGQEVWIYTTLERLQQDCGHRLRYDTGTGSVNIHLYKHLNDDKP